MHICVIVYVCICALFICMFVCSKYSWSQCVCVSLCVQAYVCVLGVYVCVCAYIYMCFVDVYGCMFLALMVSVCVCVWWNPQLIREEKLRMV